MDRTLSARGLSRRTLLSRLTLGLGSAALLPHLSARRALAAVGTKPTFLVVVNQFGGNDSMNTYVPYGLGAYHDARPRIGLADEEVLPIVPGEGLHPSLAPIHPLWAAGDLAVVRQTGYPDPNLSHFESADIWSRGLRDLGRTTDARGWIGRAADLHFPGAAVAHHLARAPQRDLQPVLVVAGDGQLLGPIQLETADVGGGHGDGDPADVAHAAGKAQGVAVERQRLDAALRSADLEAGRRALGVDDAGRHIDFENIAPAPRQGAGHRRSTAPPLARMQAEVSIVHIHVDMVPEPAVRQRADPRGDREAGDADDQGAGEDDQKRPGHGLGSVHQEIAGFRRR